MTEEFIPTLSHATERDIDLLLVEELHASAPFAAWMAGQIGWTTPVVRTTVLHSKRRTRSRREIDIFVELHHSGGKTSAILIENKLDATEQPDQAESYLEEVEVLRNSYDAVAAVIVCPKAYAAQYPVFASKFHVAISYEYIADYFRSRSGVNEDSTSGLALRLAFRADMVEQAVFKHRRGYNPILNIQVGDFKANYVAVLNELFPSVRPGVSMLKPSAPDGSRSMLFDVETTFADLPSEIRPRRFAHELGSETTRKANYVAVTFPGWGSALPSLREQLEQDTEELGVEFFTKTPTKKRPRPGLVMAVRTESVDHLGNFEEQFDVLTAGMQRVEEVRDWLIRNKSVVMNWKALIDEIG